MSKRSVTEVEEGDSDRETTATRRRITTGHVNVVDAIDAVTAPATVSATAPATSPATPNASPKHNRPMLLYEDALTRLVTDVRDKMHALLSREEHVRVLDAYLGASVDARRLYARLFLRKHAWLKCETLGQNYAEVEDVAGAVRELVAVRLLEDDTALTDCRTALELLSADQLRTVCKNHLPARGCTTRDAILDFMTQQFRTQSTLTTFGFGARSSLHDVVLKRCRAALGRVVRVDRVPVAMLQRMLVALFGLTSWSEDVLHEEIMVVVQRRRFAAYDVERGCLFETREKWMGYVDALAVERELDDLIAAKSDEEAEQVYDRIRPKWDQLMDECMYGVMDDDSSTEPRFLKQYQPAWVYTRILSKSLPILARLRKYEREAELLQALLNQRACCRMKRGGWWNRLMLVLEKLTKKDGGDGDMLVRSVAPVARMALDDKYLKTGHRRAVEERLARIDKSYVVSTHTEITPPSSTIFSYKISDGTTGTKSRWMEHDVEAAMTVEECVLHHKRKQGWRGHHCENAILTTLFSLLFWDIVFAPVSQVFQNGYQSCPLDMFTEFFYDQRKDKIDKRLDELASEDNFANKMITEVHNRECPSSTICVGVQWDYPLEDLLEVVECLGKQRLTAICTLYAHDYRARRGGFPDLLLWKAGGVTAPNIMAVEVKGPGDRLMDKQKVWLDELMRIGVDVEVCHVKDT